MYEVTRATGTRKGNESNRERARVTRVIGTEIAIIGKAIATKIVGTHETDKDRRNA
jgi:hypothetical protein